MNGIKKIKERSDKVNNFPTCGDIVQIHSYKHNGNVHRAWKEVVIIEATDTYVVAANNRTKVIESDGRSWYTREPAICYFMKDHWFNVIGMFRKDGIYFYCNLSSPYLFEEETIKYVDYDLDVKVFPNFNYKVLDRDEYDTHRVKMNYPIEVEKIVEDELNMLIETIIEKKGPFKPGFMEKYYQQYKTMK
jgi:protein associated with RNAse G/E